MKVHREYTYLNVSSPGGESQGRICMASPNVCELSAPKSGFFCDYNCESPPQAEDRCGFLPVLTRKCCDSKVQISITSLLNKETLQFEGAKFRRKIVAIAICDFRALGCAIRKGSQGRRKWQELKQKLG